MTADLTMIGLWRETAAFEQEVGGSLRSEAIDTLLASLPERERVVLQGRFGLADGQEHTLQELADELGLTRERIRQIQRSGICRLVVLFRDPGFDYLAREYQRRPPHS
jgi:RNA polymerase sigma factor (sigma-70 family)